MPEHQIQFVNKGNHGVDHITEVGGTGESNWRLTVGSVIRRISQENARFYTLAPTAGGTQYKAYVEVVPGAGGRPYIRTEKDGTRNDNLLSLPPIPAGYRLID